MGFRFRKSKKVGPFKVNLSKSGIGWSIGTKGMRYTKRADGKKQTTISIPGTGISYVDVQGSKGNSNKVNHNNYTGNNSVSNMSNDGNNNIHKEKFYKRQWFMWLMLFLIPPIGIILLWLYSDYRKAIKVILSIFFGLVAIGYYSGNDTKTTDKNTSSVESVQDNKEYQEASSEDLNKEQENTNDNVTENKTISTGWDKEGNDYYYYDNGNEVKNRWVDDNGKKYYFDNQGKMQTGWINLNNKYYYCDESGAMKTGWIQDGSNWYYLNSNGTMATSGEKDGYSINSQGIATKIEKNNTQKNDIQKSTSQSNSQKNSTSNSNTSNFSVASKDNTTNEPASNERIVYWTPGGKSYHYNDNCPTLKRSKTILSGKGSECPKTDPCNVCVK